MEYSRPVVTDFGSIVEHTFGVDNTVKGCQSNCHLDKFTENSGLSGA